MVLGKSSLMTHQKFTGTSSGKRPLRFIERTAGATGWVAFVVKGGAGAAERVLRGERTGLRLCPGR